MSSDAGSDRWKGYCEKTRKLPPSKSLEQALNLISRFPSPESSAIDLGCGAGRDTLRLLELGWSVLAIDRSESALEILKEDSLENKPLTTRYQQFEEIETLPPAGLINPSFSLPFCSPSHFPTLWGKILDSLKPGSFFCGQFFGPSDDWSKHSHMTFLSREGVEECFTSMETLILEEREYDEPTVSGDMKHWHVFTVCARRATTACATEK